MDITIHTTFLPHTDPEASLGFYRDLLGFELAMDVGQGAMRWLTFVAPSAPGVRLVLTPPAADPGITEAERRTVLELMAKGAYQSIILATADLDGTFATLQAADVEVVAEPTEQPWGVRDCAFRDPAGNMVRIDEVR
ncbi:VOC family protein [Cellulosimicrobium terreum]|nr:VOC family protein [Cellulosimicrobium terreum]